MQLLEFWPRQPHHLLQSAGQTVRAGETFEVSDENVSELLANDEIRRPAATTLDTIQRKQDERDEQDAKDTKDHSKTQSILTHSPGRAERSPTT